MHSEPAHRWRRQTRLSRPSRYLLFVALATSVTVLASGNPARSYDPTIELEISPSGVLTGSVTFTVSGDGVAGASEVRVYDDLDNLVGADTDGSDGWTITSNAADLPRGHVTFTPVAVVASAEIDGVPVTREVRPACAISEDTTWHAIHSPIHASGCSIAADKTLTIEAGTTVSPVSGTFTVGDGRTLVLEEGVTLRFSSSSAKIQVTAGGTLTAVGTSGDPAVLEASSGNGWAGIHVGGSSGNQAEVDLEWTELSGVASSVTTGAFNLGEYYDLTLDHFSTDAHLQAATSTSTDAETYLEITDSDFGGAGSNSVTIGGSSSDTTSLIFEDNTATKRMRFYRLAAGDQVTGNFSEDYTTFTNSTLTPGIATNSTDAGAYVGFDGSTVYAGSPLVLGDNQTWRVSNTLTVGNGAALHLEAGAHVVGASASSKINVTAGGALVGQGTSNNPVVLEAATANGWGGVQVGGSSSNPAVVNLEWVELNTIASSVSAGAFTLAQYSELSLDYFETDSHLRAATTTSTDDGTNLEITNSEFAGVASSSSVIVGSSSTKATSVLFDNNTSNGRMLFYGLTASDQVTNNYSGDYTSFNGGAIVPGMATNAVASGAYVLFSAAQLAAGDPVVLHDSPHPWRISGTLTVPDGAILEISEGGRVEGTSASSKVHVAPGGTLVASGSSSDPVELGASTANGWAGIQVGGTSAKPATVDMEWAELTGIAPSVSVGGFTLNEHYDLTLSHLDTDALFKAATSSSTDSGTNLNVVDSIFRKNSTAVEIGSSSYGPTTFTFEGNESLAGAINITKPPVGAVIADNYSQGNFTLSSATLAPEVATNATSSTAQVRFSDTTVATGDLLVLHDDQTWYLNGILSIPNGATLQLDAGTTVLGSASGKIAVAAGGVLQANGTSSDPVTIDAFGSTWLGISADGTSANPAVIDMEWVHLLSPATSILTLQDNYDLDLSHSMVDGPLSAATTSATQSGADLTVTDSTFTSTTATSVKIGATASSSCYKPASLVFENNTLNGGMEVFCLTGSPGYSLSGNDLSGNLKLTRVELLPTVTTNQVPSGSSIQLIGSKIAPGAAVSLGPSVTWVISTSTGSSAYDLTVPATSTLAIAAGAEVSIGSTAKIQLQGSLSSIGEEADPILIDGNIQFSPGASAEFDWTTITGTLTPGYNYHLDIDHSTLLTALSLTDHQGYHETMADHHVHIANSSLAALNVGKHVVTYPYHRCPDPMEDTTITNNTIVGNLSITCMWAEYDITDNVITGDYRIHDSYLYPGISTNSVGQQVEMNYVSVAPGDPVVFGPDQVWETFQTRYSIPGSTDAFHIDQGATLELEAGASLFVRGGDYIKINQGAFITSGTEEHPVTIAASGTSSWGSIRGGGTSDSPAHLEMSYTEITGGGSYAFELDRFYELDLEYVTLEDSIRSHVTTTGVNGVHIDIANSYLNGVQVSTVSGGQPISSFSFNDNTVNGHASLAQLPPSGYLLTGNDFNNNVTISGSTVEPGIHTNTVPGNRLFTLWESQVAPGKTVTLGTEAPWEVYHSLLVPETSTLTVEPGTDIKFRGPSVGIMSELRVDGTLEAAGTPANPIRLHGNGDKGSWTGLYVTEGGEASLEWVDIVDAGQSWGAGGRLTAIAVYGEDAVLNLTNVLISHNAGSYAMRAHDEGVINIVRTDVVDGPLNIRVEDDAQIVAPNTYWSGKVPGCSDDCDTSDLTPVSYVPYRIPAHAAFWGHLANGAWHEAVNTGLGSYTRSFVDVDAPAAGQPDLQLVRTYNSANQTPGAFGLGWTASFEMSAVEVDGEGAVSVRLPDGRAELFEADGEGGYTPPTGVHSELEGVSGGYRYTTNDGTEYLLTGPSFEVTRITNLAGNTLEILYGISGAGKGRPAGIYSPTNYRGVWFTWGTSGITAATTPHGTWTYTYSGGRLTSACNAMSKCTSYAYDALPALSVITYPEGNKEWIFYEAAEDDDFDKPSFHVIQTRDGEYNPTDFDYSTPGQRVVTDPLERETTYYINTKYQVTRVKDDDGNSTWYGYDNDGNQDQITDRTGRTTSFEYNSKGFVTEKTEPGGFTTYYGRGTYGHLLWERDPRSSGPSDNTYKTTYSYDGDWNLEEVHYPDEGQVDAGHIEQTWTDGSESAVGGGTMPAGLLESRTDARGKTTEFFYDSQGDLRRIEHPDGAEETFTHNEAGQVLTHTDGEGNVVTNTYNAVGLLATTTYPEVTNPISEDSAQLRRTLIYDDNRRLISVVEEDSVSEEEHSTSYTYDDADRVATVTHPDSSTTTFEYDEVGNRIKATDPDGRVTHHAYNHLDLLTDTWTGTIHQDNLVEHRSYDNEGRLETVVDGRGITTTYQYETASGRLDKVIRAGVTLEDHTYDNAANPTRTGYGNNQATVDREFNNQGLLTSEKLWLTKGSTSGAYRATSYTYLKGGLAHEVSVYDSATGDSTKTAWTYDEVGRKKTETVTLETSPSVVATTTFGYDLAGNLTSVLDPEGNETVHEYNEAGQLEKTIHPSASHWNGSSLSTSSAVEEFGYDGFGNLTHYQNPNGAVTVDEYDSMGRLVERTHPTYTDHTGGPVTPEESWGYDHVGNLTSHTGRDNKTTSFSYDNLGRLETQTDPALAGQEAGTTEYEYDGWSDLVTKVSDPEDRFREYTYDNLDRLQKSSAGGGADTVRSYDTLGNLISLDAPEVAAETWTYNTAGRALTHTDPAGKTWSYTYGPYPDPLTITDPLTHTTTNVYDAAGRLLNTTNARGNKTSYTYDKNGLLTSETSPRGNTGQSPDPDYTTEFVYDAQGRLRQVLAPENRNAYYDYDKAGQLARVRNNRSGTPTTLYEYNAGGLLTSLTDPEEREWSYSYDAAGRLRIEEQPGNVEITYGYDNLGNQTSSSATGDNLTAAATSRAYDRAGLLVEVSHPDGTIGIEYNSLGLVEEVDAPYGTTSYGYDSLGRLTNVTDAVGAFTYGYNSRSLLTTINDPLTSVNTTFTYDEAGRLEKLIYGDREHSYGYYDNDQLETETVTDTDLAATLASFSYDYDPDGNPSTVEIDYPEVSNPAEGLYTYTYDPGGYLASLTLPDTATLTYNYDQAGNRTQAGDATYSYDKSDRLTGSTDPVHGAATYTYAPSGALLQISGGPDPATFTYDALGRTLTQAVDTGSGIDTATFTYDSLGRIASRGDGTTEHDFVYRGVGSDPISDGVWSYALSPNGRPVAVGDGTNTYTTGFNRHGDLTTLYTPQAGTPSVVGTTVYDPYGQVLGQTGVATPLGFQTDWTDPLSGRVSMHARWYDGGLGAFTSRDSYPGELTSTHTLNRYAYALPNPLANHDPSGYCGLPINIISTIASWAGELSGGGRCDSWDAIWEGTKGQAVNTATAIPNGLVGVGRFGVNALAGIWNLTTNYSETTAPVREAAYRRGYHRENLRQAFTGAALDMGRAWVAPVADWELARTDPAAYQRNIGEFATDVYFTAAGVKASAARVGSWADNLDFRSLGRNLDLGLDIADTMPPPGSIVYGPLDDLGRPTGTYAHITQEMVMTGSGPRQSIRPPGFVDGRKSGQARGHLLARQLGGSGADRRNLVTLKQNPANRTMAKFEGDIRRAVENGELVEYVSRPVYDGVELIPRGVTLHARGTGGFALDITILNR